MEATPQSPPIRRERWLLGFSLGLNVVLAAALLLVAANLHNTFDPPRQEIAARVDKLLDRVELPDTLRTETRESFLTTFDRLHENMRKLHEKRRELTRDVIVNPDDDGAADRLEKQMNRMHAQMDLGALETLRAASRKMTPEQRERFAAALEEMMPGPPPDDKKPGS